MHVTSFRKSLPRTLCFIRVSAIPHACHVDPEKHPRNLMFHTGLSNIHYIEFSQRMPLNPAYYSKPELMVFECPRLRVTPYDLAYIYTPNWWFWSPWAPFFAVWAQKSFPKPLCFIRVWAIPHACHVVPKKPSQNLMFHKVLSNSACM